MRGIGGNTTASVQISLTAKNEIGESVQMWETVQMLRGWLDLSGGDSRYMTYNAKVQESTHIFVADYTELDARIKTENSRMLIAGGIYDVKLIDNPMGMKDGSQLEIYLAYTGGQ